MLTPSLRDVTTEPLACRWDTPRRMLDGFPFCLSRCKISSMRYHANQYDSLDTLIKSDRGDTADENVIDGLQHQQGERWAGWATQVDMRADIERIMYKLADKYADSVKHQVALYHLTTQVSRIDATKIVGADPFR
jgi:hypothetical protein